MLMQNCKNLASRTPVSVFFCRAKLELQIDWKKVQEAFSDNETGIEVGNLAE
jgi:hypothetical protein